MGRDISLFTNFSQNENRVTNYCGLILKMLYQENPESFQNLLATFTTDENKENFEILPKFEQQAKKKESIPDLCISQKAFDIYFETKTTDWFKSDQIQRHINSLIAEIDIVDSQNSKNILFLLTSEFEDSTEQLVNQLSSEFKGITLQLLTFENLLGALKDVSEGAGNYFKSTLAEFESYLDTEGLLPKWKHTLDIINCVGTKNEVALGMYGCPNSGGAYRHKRAKYFGAYWNKNVNYVAEIRAVVIVGQRGKDVRIAWNNSGEKEEYLCREAREKLDKCEDWRKKEMMNRELQIFLLGELRELDHQKISKGGMMGSKVYRDVDANNLEELYAELNGKTWR